MLEFCFMAEMTKSNAKGAYDDGGRRKYLSRAEGHKFVQHATALPTHHALFCLTVYYTGCRISEALALSHQDVDLDTKAVRIRSLKKRDKHEIRRLPIPAFLVTGLLGIDPLGKNETLWQFSRTTGWRIIKTVMRQAEISGVHATTKGLRHGFGVRSAMMRIPPNIIQRWMGHADLATTGIYLAVRDDEERELIEKTW